MNVMRVAALVVVAGAGLFTSLGAAGQDGGRPKYTDADWALLPEWCFDSQDGPFGSPLYTVNQLHGRNGSPRSDHWTSVFGRDFWHIHHICRARYHERRAAVAVAAVDRVASLSKAIDDYQYVIANCKPTMVLMPEVYFRQAELYVRTGDMGRAALAYASSRRSKPDYWPAYTRWADELVKLRLVQQASELIDEGLRHSPDQVDLIERRRSLDARLGAARSNPPGAAASR